MRPARFRTSMALQRTIPGILYMVWNLLIRHARSAKMQGEHPCQ